jgi:hypothetical protein
MTAIARSSRQARSTHVIDVRCSAALPRDDGHECRCQLFAGHDGSHAVMYAQCGRRMVRTWRAKDRASAVFDCTTMHSRPWMYGYPVPAWFEDEPEPTG